MNRIFKYSAGFTALVVILALPFTASAQGHRKQTLILNDGTRITGTVVSDSGDYLRVRVTTPQVVSIPRSEVFTRNPAPGDRPPQRRRQPYDSKDNSGYNIRISASVLSGQNDQGRTGTMSFHFMNGYQFDNGLATGIGAGIEEFETVIMPVYADLRYQSLKSRISPFAWIKSGIGIPVGNKGGGEYYGYSSDARSGAMFNAGAGITLYTGRNLGVNVGLGYRYQQLTFRQENTWGRTMNNEFITHFNRTEVQFGFIFR